MVARGAQPASQGATPRAAGEVADPRLAQLLQMMAAASQAGGGGYVALPEAQKPAGDKWPIAVRVVRSDGMQASGCFVCYAWLSEEPGGGRCATANQADGNLSIASGKGHRLTGDTKDITFTTTLDGYAMVEATKAAFTAGLVVNAVVLGGPAGVCNLHEKKDG